MTKETHIPESTRSVVFAPSFGGDPKTTRLLMRRRMFLEVACGCLTTPVTWIDVPPKGDLTRAVALFEQYHEYLLTEARTAPAPAIWVSLLDWTLHGHAMNLGGPDALYDVVCRLLIAAFPDLHWIALDAESRQPTAEIARQLEATACPEIGLFDASGLQARVRGEIRSNEPALCQSIRRRRAVVVDDEEAYAYFSAYVAFRFGFRVSVVSSFGRLEALRDPRPEPPDLTIEDLFLNFPDMPGTVTTEAGEPLHLSRLLQRDQRYPQLTNASGRVIVTTGSHPTQEGFLSSTVDYLKQWRGERKQRRWWRTCLKPVSGIFGMWEEVLAPWRADAAKRRWRRHGSAWIAGGLGRCVMFLTPGPRKSFALSSLLRLAGRLRERVLRWKLAHLRRAYAEFGLPLGLGVLRSDRPDLAGFETQFATDLRWDRDPSSDQNPHSADGRLLLVASRLLERAERLLREVGTVKEAVRGAVLSTQALELLGGRTPTTSYEALSLRHQFEVLAECQFDGMRQAIETRPRFLELAGFAQAIGRGFAEVGRKAAVSDFLMKCLSRLKSIFQGYGQFDEELKTLAQVRTLYSALWADRPGALRPLRRVLLSVVSYVNLLLQSIPIFLCSVVFWILLFASLYRLGPEVANLSAMNPDELRRYSEYLKWGPSVGAAFEGFFGVQKPGEPAILVDYFVIGFGFVHLGVGISHLYTIASRR